MILIHTGTIYGHLPDSSEAYETIEEIQDRLIDIQEEMLDFYPDLEVITELDALTLETIEEAYPYAIRYAHDYERGYGISVQWCPPELEDDEWREY